MLVALLALLLGVPTGATAAWLSPAPTIVDGTGRASSYRIASGPNGHSVAVWQYYDSGPAQYRIQFAAISPTGSVAPVQSLSPQGPGSLLHAPAVAVGPDGTATVAWVLRVITDAGPPLVHDDIVQAVRISPTGAVGPVQAVSPAGQQAAGPSVGVGPDGRSTIVWYRSDGSTNAAMSAQLSPTGDVGPVRTLNPPGTTITWPQFAMSADGTSTVVWRGTDGGERVHAVRLNVAGEPAGPVRPLTDADGSAVADVTVAAAADGSSTAIATLRLNNVERLQAIRIAADGTVGPAKTVASSTGGFDPVIGGAADGSSTVAWIDQADERVRAVRINPHGAVGAAQTLSPPGTTATGLSIATAPHGTSTIAWGTYAPSDPGMSYAVRMGPSGALGPVERISSSVTEPAYDPQVAVAANGISTAVWSTTAGIGQPTHLRGTVLQIPDPVLSIAVPPAGTAGVPLALSGQSNDAFDPVTYRWNLGDGVLSTGAQITHTYGAPGAFTVTATATNLLGRSASAAATVGIAPAPVAPLPPVPPVPPVRPREPTLELRDGTLRLRSLAVKRAKKAKTCPTRARLTISTRVRVRSGKRTVTRTISSNRNVTVKKSGTGCRVTTTVKLKGHQARAGRATVTLRSSALTGLKRTIPARKTLSVTRTTLKIDHLVVRSTQRDQCPSHATVTITGATKATSRIKATKRTTVRLAPVKDCRTSTTVKLPARLRATKKLTVTVSGRGLTTTKRALSR